MRRRACADSHYPNIDPKEVDKFMKNEIVDKRKGDKAMRGFAPVHIASMKSQLKIMDDVGVDLHNGMKITMVL